MKQLVLLLSVVFLLGVSTSAQVVSQNISSPNYALGGADTNTSANLLAANPFAGPPNPPSLAPAASSDASGGSAAAPPQEVYGVRPVYTFEGYLGYTFMRFYEVPNTTVNLNGFDYSIVYFPKSWLGAEGEFTAAFGSQAGYPAKFLLGLGGIRVRTTPFQHNIEVWGHALVGATHFVPQTAYGGQGAFAYEVGAGVDINLRNPRYAIRAGADMVGSLYFKTYQLSPKISAGFVYRF